MLIKKYKDILPYNVFWQLSDELGYWNLINCSINVTDTNKFWGIHSSNLNDSVLRNAQTYIKLKIQRDIPYYIDSLDYHVGGSTPNQRGSIFHKDYPEKYNAYTFVLYMTSSWNTQWGGETIVCDPQNEYHYSPYVPNCGILFPAHWDHYGATPNGYAKEMRKTIAFRYRVCYNSPIATN